MITWAKIIAILIGMFVMAGVIIVCDSLIIKQIIRFKRVMECILQEIEDFRRSER